MVLSQVHFDWQCPDQEEAMLPKSRRSFTLSVKTTNYICLHYALAPEKEFIDFCLFVCFVRDFCLLKFQDIVLVWLKFWKSLTFPNFRTISVYIDLNVICLWCSMHMRSKCPATKFNQQKPSLFLFFTGGHYDSGLNHITSLQVIAKCFHKRYELRVLYTVRVIMYMPLWWHYKSLYLELITLPPWFNDHGSL